ncbi:MAG: GNAT family N-acetyltransferase [Micavibrio aeruginosavorus]|uniref:GNAT family N-acetyltransferase n=1 Tax=Micavibrio aeruginosavorus TaxID=349221 RepID=A0A7T5R341_9BACT|nr:MAG: GNAT family N-acetyltransferase [Micavibrio aeruginosavorus]
MPYQPLQERFDPASARRRHDALSAEIPAGLGVNRSFLHWEHVWNDLLVQSPSAFYQTLARNMPGELSVFVDFASTHDAEITCSLKKNGRFVFEAENKIIRDGQGKKLRFEEWVVKEPEQRGQGIGLNLLRNFISVAQAAGFDSLSLRAGKEDGKYFWARHGFDLKDGHYRDQLVVDIRNNLEKHSDTIPLATRKNVMDLLDRGGLDLCWHLARLPGTVQGKPLGWVLMQGYNPEYAMDLHNSEQMTRVQASFEQLSLSTRRLSPQTP